MIIFGLILFTIKFSKPKYTRIACWPVFSENTKLSFAVADRVQYLLQTAVKSETDIIIYDQKNTFEIIDFDMNNEQTFLKKFAESIDLDYVLFISTREYRNNSSLIDINFFNVQKKTSELIVDTLYFEHVQSFFTTNKKPYNHFLDKELLLNSSELLSEKDQWEKLGYALFYIFDKQYSTADTILNSLLQREPKNIGLKKHYISLLLDKALLLKSEGDYYQEIFDRIFQIVKDNDSLEDDAMITKLLGRMYVHNENWNFAFTKLSRALHMNPADPEIYFYLSKLHGSRLKDIGFSSKIDLLKKSISINPAYIIPSLKLGQIYLKRREFDNAARIYKNLLQINPNSIDALHGLGKMYLIQNNPVEFIKIYKRMLTIDPDNSRAYYNLGIAYLNSKNLEEAERFFRKSIEIDTYKNSYFYLGVIFALKNKKDKAISYFLKTIESGKEDEYTSEARKAITKLNNNQEIIHLRSFHGFGR